MSTLLVGTEPEVRLLAHQLAMVRGRDPIAGIVIVEGDEIGDLEAACAGRTISLAIMTAPRGRRAELAAVRRRLESMGIPARFIAPLSEQADVRVADRPAGSRPPEQTLDPAQLVGRAPHEIDREQVGAIIDGRTVLVTGAGGSIGSELVRVCAQFAPRRIVLMERAENALFEIDRSIGSRFPGLDRVALLHDVVDERRTLELVKTFAPDVIFHAAAHKHVPLMEDHPALAVENNVFGTKSIADAAVAVGAERFVLISSDKAVRPSSVMGATKRLAERYVQALAADPSHDTRLSMVRFGNVLGSSGSVLTIWNAQLAEGGPLTVTDERMTRYFMTIAEAASLVVQAAAFSGTGPHPAGTRSGEVFVLDMGEPVRILDLAARYAMASGYTPVLAGRTPPPTDCPIVEIVLTEARPGEKLHEELAYRAEQLEPTAHPGIRAMGERDPIDPAQAARVIEELGQACGCSDRGRVLDLIRRHVPDIAPGGDLGQHQEPAIADQEAA
ncbi:MAG: polysaccharide biosynthesis protein [Phycisphaerales bacterium]